MDTRRLDIFRAASMRSLSRRGALGRLVTGGALAALLADAGLGRTRVAAQQGTPAAGAGLYVVIRRYPLAPGASVAELTRRVREGFVPIISQVPGFVEYYTYDAGGGDSGTISVFSNAAAAAESSERAAAWVAQADLGAFFTGRPR